MSNWVYQRATALESSDEENWPQNGHQLATVFFTILETLSRVGFVRLVVGISAAAVVAAVVAAAAVARVGK